MYAAELSGIDKALAWARKDNMDQQNEAREVTIFLLQLDGFSGNSKSTKIFRPVRARIHF